MVSGISGANNYDYLQQMGQYGSKNGNISMDELFSKIDTNGDGSISKDELAKALTATHHHHHHHGKSSDATSQTNATSPLDQLFSKIDSNGGDGSISKDELSAFQSNLEAQLTGSVTGASTTTSTVSNQQSQANGIQSLLTNAISMYTQLSQLGSVISGIGSLAVTG